MTKSHGLGKDFLKK